MLPPAHPKGGNAMQIIEATQVERLLDVARETIATVRHCWVATVAPDGGANARAVRAFPGGPGADEWTRRFLCRRESRKVAEMQRAPRVTLAYQTSDCDRYVGLIGRARVIDDRAEMRGLWSGDWDRFFPPGFADAHMVVANVEVDRIEIHARGITAEPFGHGRTWIERIDGGAWRLVP
jgi:general stress protein 26